MPAWGFSTLCSFHFLWRIRSARPTPMDHCKSLCKIGLTSVSQNGIILLVKNDQHLCLEIPT